MSKKGANKQQSPVGNKPKKEKNNRSSETDNKRSEPKGFTKGLSSENGATKEPKREKSGTSSTNYGLWIALAFTVAAASVVMMHEETKLYLVQLTGAGSDPLQYVNSMTSERPASAPESAQQQDSQTTSGNKETRTKPSDTPDIKPTSHKDGGDVYILRNISTDQEMKFAKQLDSADNYRKKKDFQKALDRYDNILRKHGTSPRAMWGRALVLIGMAEQQKSNSLLEDALGILNSAMRLPEAPRALVAEIGPTLAHWMQFRGWRKGEVKTWQYMTEIFPDQINYQRMLVQAYMTVGQNEKAKTVLNKILELDPGDGFALVHLAFIVKNDDLDYERSTDLFARGLATDAEGIQLGKFYVHFGDAYIKLKQPDKAKEVFTEAERRGLFLSRDQRSTYNADHPLTARPFWTAQQTGYQKFIDLLEKNWEIIRDEALALFNSTSEQFDSSENLLEDEKDGDWRQFTFFRQGKKFEEPCKKAPKTCRILSQIQPATSCTRGQIKFSAMQGGIHVWPHTGPTNCRLRAHLGLVVPEGPVIRVVNETKTWQEGKVFIFDDSFEHEVWHHGTKPRLVLIIDFWHPELTERDKKTLHPI